MLVSVLYLRPGSVFTNAFSDSNRVIYSKNCLEKLSRKKAYSPNFGVNFFTPNLRILLRIWRQHIAVLQILPQENKMAVADRQVLRQLFLFNFPIERPIRDDSNPLEFLSEGEVFLRYRFRPSTILYIVSLIHIKLTVISRRNSDVPPLLQTLVCLRCLASASFQLVVGDCFGLSQASVSRCFRKVSSAIASLTTRFVRFPVGERVSEVKSSFRSIAGK